MLCSRNSFARTGLASVLCAAGLLLFTGCAGTTDTTRAAPKLTSSEVEDAIKVRLSANPGLSDVKVDADTPKDRVTLSGTVETQALRTQALQAVRNVNAAVQIDDQIEVKPRELTRADYTEDMARQARDKAKGVGEKVGSTLDDAWIHTKITSKLLGDKDTPARKINVDVEKNVVTLRGTVPDQTAKAEATRIANETEGVKRVVNLLKVDPQGL